MTGGGRRRQGGRRGGAWRAASAAAGADADGDRTASGAGQAQCEQGREPCSGHVVLGQVTSEPIPSIRDLARKSLPHLILAKGCLQPPAGESSRGRTEVGEMRGIGNSRLGQVRYVVSK